MLPCTPQSLLSQGGGGNPPPPPMKHEILKNFPVENEVREILAGLAAEIQWSEFQYFWLFTYRLK